MERFIYALICLAIGLVLGVYNAWLFIDLWKWFVVPLGFPTLTLWAAYGLMMVIQWPFASIHIRNELNSEDESSEVAGKAITAAIMLSAAHTITFWLGWFIKANLL